MKFLPENKKKTIILSLVFAVSLGGIVYLNFFHGRQGAPPPLPPAAQDLTQAVGGLLPHGARIDTRVLQDDRFTILIRGPELIVKPEELGKSDLFSIE
ncbi:MAG: hypothetical protein Q8R08_01620 [bacterium]|nr:hypothetical protein [bacterium]